MKVYQGPQAEGMIMADFWVHFCRTSSVLFVYHFDSKYI